MIKTLKVLKTRINIQSPRKLKFQFAKIHTRFWKLSIDGCELCTIRFEPPTDIKKNNGFFTIIQPISNIGVRIIKPDKTPLFAGAAFREISLDGNFMINITCDPKSGRYTLKIKETK